MARYHTPPGDGLEPIVREFQKDRRQLREQARPDADQIGETLRRIQEQQAYQASLITRSVAAPTTTVDPIPGDMVIRYVNSAYSITMPVTTGRALVTVGGLIRLVPGNSSAAGYITFNAAVPPSSTPWWPSGMRSAQLFSGSPGPTYVSVSVQVPVLTGPAGDRTFTLAYGSWSSSISDPAEVHFEQTYMTVQVIDPEPV